MLLSGEPGVGKSRLVAALEERIGEEPHHRLRYFCSPHHQNSALYPIIAQLEGAAGFERDDILELKLEKLEALLARFPLLLRTLRSSPICCRWGDRLAIRLSISRPSGKRRRPSQHASVRSRPCRASGPC